MLIEVVYVAASAAGLTLLGILWPRRLMPTPKLWFRVGYRGSEQRDFIEAESAREAASELFFVSGNPMVARIIVEGTGDHEGEQHGFNLNYSCHCKPRRGTD